MLSGDGNENSQKTVGLISKKKKHNNFAPAAHFFVHFFAVVLHDGNVRLPETSELHVLLRKFYMWSCSRFSLPLIFNLVAASISHFLMHRRYKIFMLFFKRNWSPLFFYLWLYLFLCYTRQ